MGGRTATRSLPRRSLIAGSAAAAIASVVPYRPAHAVTEVIVGKDGWLFSYFDTIERVDLARVKQTAGLINSAVAVLKQANIPVMLNLTPAKSRIYREYLPNGTKFSAAGEQRYAVILEELRKPGTVVPDMATALGDLHKARPADALFFKADTHWTSRGAEPAAMAMADQIKAKLPMPPSSVPGNRLGMPINVAKTENDLANLLPPIERAKYPLEFYPLRQVGNEGQGGALGGLVGEDAADTVVVGNSFMHPRFGYAAMLSSQLNRPVYLQWKVHQFSPFFNLVSYLKSATFKQQRPKLIVWNFHEPDLGVAMDSAAIWGQSAMQPQAILSEMRQATA